MQPAKVLFLPGAGGSPDFWRPAGRCLRTPAERVYFGWPGCGSVPPDPDVRSLEDLAERVLRTVDRPVALVAQSMGGVVAVHAALARGAFITHLVLAVTSGGLGVAALGAKDWRPDFVRANPDVPRWFLDDRSDYTERLPEIAAPTLLLWGDSDPISPVAIAEQLRARLPRASLVVIPGGTHDLAVTHAAHVARLIDEHLARG